MRRAERLLLGAWVGILATHLAILASALPYIYTTQDDGMRCGSLGLSRFALGEVPGLLFSIVALAIALRVWRAFVYPIRWSRGLLAWFGDGVAFLASMSTWVATTLAGVFTMALLLLMLAVLLQNPPPLPTDVHDVNACGEFILNTKPYDPFKGPPYFRQFFEDFSDMFVTGPTPRPG
jgi:hypothetical protein